MKNESFLAQLNLRPQEKRIIFVIMVIVFLVLNIVMVWPHFSDWAKIKAELNKTTEELHKENLELAHDFEATNGYKKQLAKLERDQKGGVALVADESLLLQRAVRAQAPKCGVDINTSTPGSAPAGTNEFFDEQTLSITFEAQESNLVNFLYNVGNDPSMVRIRELRLNPADTGRFKLKGSILLAANYEKRPPIVGAPGKPGAASGAQPKPPAGAMPGKIPTLPPLAAPPGSAAARKKI